jgi:hypothetical protein
MRVDSDGDVVRAEAGDTGFPESEIARCVVGVYRSAHLPTIHRRLAFVYALHLEASNPLPVADSTNSP